MLTAYRIIVVFFFCTVSIHSQNLLPPIYNYKLSEYKGASKNWGVAVNPDGELFVANNKGLLHYNGEKWVLYKLPNNTIVRSVAVIGDKIFTGSYEEFGFWLKDDLGSLQYTSLTHLIKDHEFTSEEFWEIRSVKDQVVFRSFSAIYTYNGDTIAVLDPTQVISDILALDGKLIVGGSSEGLFELGEDELVPLENQEILMGKAVTDMIPYGDGILVGTKLNGCYVLNENGIRPWEAALNQELKQHQLNKILRFDGEQIAFGTIKNGIYLYNQNTDKSKVLNREAGLQNNTVLSMARFRDQLWLGLDNGIARAELHNPITYYTDFSGTLGMVYDMALHNDKLYLGSNTGVFYFDENELKFVEGSQGHVWDLEVVEGDLLCGHNTGTYKVELDNFEQISSFSGGYGLVRIPERRSGYIQGFYNGLVKYEKDGVGDWEVSKIEGINVPIKYLCFETPHVLWAAHSYKGFYRIQLDDTYSKVVDIKEYLGSQTPSAYNIKIYQIKNQIVFRGEKSWYKYDPILDRISVFEEFQKFNSQELLFYEEDQFWFVNRDGKKEIIHTDLKQDSLAISDFSLNERLAPDSQNLIKVNDSTSYITLSDGFAMIHENTLKDWLHGLSLPIPHINLVRDERSAYSGIQDPVRVPYKNSQILTFEVSSPELLQSRYHYELLGPKSYAEFVESGTIQFQNLSHGEYLFKVSNVGHDNKISEAQTFAFEIAPPWFLSGVSIALYVLLGIATVFVVRYYNRRKLRRKQKELELQMKKEQEEQMAAMEKEKLAREIKLKQNELASTTLNIAKKNEMILELKNMLLVNKDKFSNSQRYRSFIKKLNSSIQDTDDWKRFEVNFKELHEDFFERLLKAYPKLTPKDLKLCAYLKMNLSTKEIAPLMAISVRGVEIHRYRLRKKLEIDSSKSLSNFLITF
ncbi:LuxR C-terminal-related transcriptional regulator [Flagellimonas flava]|uniref:helix-turn-helix and ligand-binding sensor domain-containing protein n=1 Tax=Flagellimonas flava TaxID=570519 RepID=UPI003D65A453